MRDFWVRQDAHRPATQWLVALLVVAVVVIVGLIDAATAWAFRGAHLTPDARTALVGWTTVLTLAIIIGGAVWRMWHLRQGGIVVAMELGGREVLRDQADAAGQRLLDVVEEMAIASGLPVPSVFLLDEEAINACAAGHTPHDAAICVTRGALQHLTRDELQGVMAHEFAHILNGDMRLNLRTMGLVHGLLAVHYAGRVILELQPRNRRDRNPLIALGFVLWGLGWVGWLAAYLIRAAICRQREVLADACGVQFTRHPEGLAGALRKILDVAHGSRLTHPTASEAAHLFFAQSGWDFWDRLVATHPPLATRLRALDPTWTGDAPTTPSPRVTTSTAVAGTTASPHAMAHLVGTLPPAALPRAAHRLAALPPSLLHATRDTQSAQAACVAAILPTDDAAWAHVTDPLVHHLGQRLAADLDHHGRLATRLTLVHLCLPALKRLSTSQAAALAQQIEAIAHADLAAAALAHIVLLHLRPQPTTTRTLPLAALTAASREVLGALAEAGSGDGDAAFAAAWHELNLPGSLPSRPASRGEAPITALAELRHAPATIKRRLVAACTQAVLADGRLEPTEAELLRLVCDSLGCPLPDCLTAAL